ncbi:activity-dependent neuroprotective protein 2a-like [Lampris incognitus]|uniref:activity-dependent neuroprotective protein 2a-like n=1 Tax=Lampris incognitus TaxID=2546036 RepID=UPI0024B4A486|nr:activity-dependent neuroprotective protein 2a-like [Lampris incognitus]
MYQFPVANIEKIRKTRRKVKKILGDFGLEDCQNFLKELREKSEENTDEDKTFKETEWVDFTDGFNGRMKKKWPYRSRSLCCSLCKYSTRNIHRFRSHIQRNHDFEQSSCALTPCSQCHFLSHSRAVKKHMLYFHTTVSNHTQTAREGHLPTHRGNERYQCRKCGFPSSSIFAMKKHVILKHLESLAQEFIGYRPQGQGQRCYCCKVCKVITGSLDQMFHHMLTDPKHHYWVNSQVQILISENKNYMIKPPPNGSGMFVTFPNIASKPHQVQTLSNGSLVLPNNGQQAGTVVALQQLQGGPSSTTLICTTRTNQAFLPPQASALVQLASAEAKGLLQPGATIALQGTFPQGSPMVQLPTTSNISLRQAPLALAPVPGHPPQNPQAQQILIPKPLTVSVAGMASSSSQPAAVTQNLITNQIPPRGTMLTSQSLLNHLIPTGNKVNGLPTYTFAPLPVTMPISHSTSGPLKPVESSNNVSLQTKKWITCPLCNELFPSNVFDMHTEVAHKTKTSTSTSKSESMAARAPFLKKMPDNTVKCLLCKNLLSEKSVFPHLLHGLNCLYCSALFFSIKQLIEHIKGHNPSAKTYCDFQRREYKVYTNSAGRILFPHFDMTTTAPKEVLGEMEVNLALVTNSLDLIFVKMMPSSHPDVCQTSVKINSAYCPFCDERFQNAAKHLEHLKEKHFVAPTIHAILKTEAFKCIYCNGVYTGKVTQHAVMLHIQRCRCSPKKQPEPPKSQESKEPRKIPVKPPAELISQPPGLYFLQIQQTQATKQTSSKVPVLAPTLKPPSVPIIKPALDPVETEEEAQSKKRLEEAWKQVVEANRREREERAAMRKRREQEKLLVPPQPEPLSEPSVKLLLEPTLVERRSNEERKDFICRYFNLNPYITKSETDELCKRLSLTKTELAAHFGNKRSKCMKSIKRSTAKVLYGFNMTELKKLKHNLYIPEVLPAEPAEPLEKEPESMEESGDSEKMDVEQEPEMEKNANINVSDRVE